MVANYNFCVFFSVFWASLRVKQILTPKVIMQMLCAANDRYISSNKCQRVSASKQPNQPTNQCPWGDSLQDQKVQISNWNIEESRIYLFYVKHASDTCMWLLCCPCWCLCFLNSILMNIELSCFSTIKVYIIKLMYI